MAGPRLLKEKVEKRAGILQHPTATMKIHFGFPNPDSINKLSPALQSLELNLLKAAPCNVALKGLHRVPQDGYSQYASHLPAFMYATESEKITPLSREGYPVLTTAINVIPLTMPSIYVAYKGSRDIPPNLKDEARSISTKDKNLKAYLLDYKTGIYNKISRTEFEKNVYPIANTISAEDLGSLITILRILSSFLRTHKYPAFPTQEEFEHEFSKSIVETKRPLTTLDDYEMSDDNTRRKKMVKVDEDGEPTWGTPDFTDSKAEIRFFKAKPVEDTTPAWGGVSSIPTTDGIVFPFVEDLATWDKETVPNAIGLYFVRCLGHSTDGCLKAFSDLSQHWKRSLHRSSIGNSLSHIFKVIELAIPSQARVFPIISNNRYLGCYLSGSGFSIALKGELYRPTTYENNQTDFDCFDGTDALLSKVAALMGITKAEDLELMYKMSAPSMRGLNSALKKRILSVSQLEKIRTVAARIRYPQDFLRINMTSIQQVLTFLKDGREPPLSFPMHASALGRTSAVELIFSAFGPTAPSPNIPGSSRISVTPRMPANFNKVLAFRTTTLETAISDWKEFGERGILYNGPDRLSGRYQYVQVRGEEERQEWFNVLNGYHVWYKREQMAGLSGEVVDIDGDEADDGVLLGLEAAIDLSGF